MPLNVERERAALERLDLQQLKIQYAELCGDSTNTRNKVWLVRRILWRLQARDEGDLSERAQRRAAELADDADLRVIPPRRSMSTPPMPIAASPANSCADRRLPVPGSVITRQYKGKQLQVKILPDGLEFEGEQFRSLSAVAKHITGSHCNGFLFFGLKDRGANRD